MASLVQSDAFFEKKTLSLFTSPNLTRGDLLIGESRGLVTDG